VPKVQTVVRAKLVKSCRLLFLLMLTSNCLIAPALWTVVFQVWQAFYPYAAFFFPSSSEVEAVFDLVLMFLLSSSCNHLLLTKEKDSSPFFMNYSFLLVHGLSLLRKRVAR